MGATKLNIKHVNSIAAEDLLVNGFELGNDMACSFMVNRPVDRGEMVLIKASFKNACEAECEGTDEVVLYRRRVVPFVTRIMRTSTKSTLPGTQVAARIESITDEDRSFFMKKYFETNGENAPLELEIEGKQIRFALA